MKDKEPTTIQTVTQPTHPYPSTPCPPSQTPRTGPKFFPPNVLPEDDPMDLPPNFIPEPPSSPDPRSPPTHPPLLPVRSPLPPTEQTSSYPENSKCQSPWRPTKKHSDLNSSIHAPGNAIVDQTMSTPSSPTANRPQNTEEETILAHLALAEANRSILSQNGINYHTTLPKFTPTPIGGFPKVHMVHSAQIFDHLDNKVLLAWFQVEHPKFMVRVFNISGKEIAERTALIAECLRASIAIIVDYVHQEIPPLRVSPPQPQGGRNAKDFPVSFLVHKIPEETKNLILNQRIWSTMDITFEALPFNCTHTPELLFCLNGFMTSDSETVRKSVVDVWSQDMHRHHIDDAFSMCGFHDDELVYKATRDLIRSVRIEALDFKVTGGLSVPRFNIFTVSPTNDVKTWTDIRGYLHLLEYPTGLDGCSMPVALFPCQICHSLAHPCGLCPFPNILQWNGPKLTNHAAANLSRQPGRSRGGQNG